MSNDEITYENLQRLKNIESILNSHGTEIRKLTDNIVPQLEKAQELITALHSSDVSQQEALKNINEKIEKIWTIKINGSANLDETLKALWVLTKKKRTFNIMVKSINNWFL
jgi:hypothetical protein